MWRSRPTLLPSDARGCPAQTLFRASPQLGSAAVSLPLSAHLRMLLLAQLRTMQFHVGIADDPAVLTCKRWGGRIAYIRSDEAPVLNFPHKLAPLLLSRRGCRTFNRSSPPCRCRVLGLRSSHRLGGLYVIYRSSFLGVVGSSAAALKFSWLRGRKLLKASASSCVAYLKDA